MSYAEELLIKIRSAYESGGFNKLDADINKAKSGYNKLSSESAKGTSSMRGHLSNVAASAKSFGSSVISAFDGIGGAITGVVAGFGLMTMATTAWTGATQAQLNKMLLTKKYGADMAESLVKNIQEIVAAVPGDDTFMNAFLSGVARIGDIQNVDTLKNVAYVASDYMNASLAAGKMSYEIQQDLTKYIQYGNTAELERGSILSSQIDSLKGKATIEERVLAMNEAMKKLGLDGLSQLDSAANMWEEVKGNIQLILTQFGTELLPYIQAVFTWFLDLNESTDGWAARLVVISGIIIAIIPLLGMFSGPFSAGIKIIEATISALTGLKGTIMGVATAEKALTSSITPADAAMGNLNINAAQGTSRLKAFATSTAGVTLGLAAMVAALIGVAYYISQTMSATKAWEEVETQRNSQVKAFTNTIQSLETKKQDLINTRTELIAQGKDVVEINRQISDTEAAIKSNTNASEEATKRYNKTLDEKNRLESLGEGKTTTYKTRLAAAKEGMTEEEYIKTIGDPETQDAVEKLAQKNANIYSVYARGSGTIDKLTNSQDTYSKLMREDSARFQKYKEDYVAFAEANENFWVAMDKGDYTGMIWYGVESGLRQGALAINEFEASVRSTILDTGGAIEEAFQGAYLAVVGWWGGIPAWFGGLGSRIGQLWQEVLNYFNDPTTVGGAVYDALKKIYCIIVGCSPGIIPALQQLYQFAVFVFNAMISPVMVVRNVIEGFVNSIMARMEALKNNIINKWNLVKAIIGVWISSGINVATGAIDWAENKYNGARALIGQWISTGVNVATNAIQTAIDWWNKLKNTIGNGIQTAINIVTGSAGSPYEIDYLYGQGEYYESDYTPMATTSTVNSVASVSSSTSKTVISEGAVQISVGSVDSPERVTEIQNAVTIALNGINNSKGR